MPSIEQILRTRRTINEFKPEIPDPQIIIDAISVARWAPNHHLTQPWRYYLLNTQMIDSVVNLNADIVTKKKGVQAGSKKLTRWKTIPGWLVVTCELSEDSLQQTEDYAACCCSIYALSLVLWQYGIGIKWTTGAVTRHQTFYDICWLDRLSQKVVGLIWYGYPKQVPDPQPRRHVDEILTIF